MIGAEYLIARGPSFSHLDLSGSTGTAELFRQRLPFRGRHAVRRQRVAHPRLTPLDIPAVQRHDPGAGRRSHFVAGQASAASPPVGRAPALTATVPSLVYGYELVASVKEIAAATLMLGLAALAVSYTSWRLRGWRDALPFALVAAAGPRRSGSRSQRGRSRHSSSLQPPSLPIERNPRAWSQTRCARAQRYTGADPRRAPDLLSRCRIAESDDRDRDDEQRGQPDPAASAHTGARDVADRALHRHPAGRLLFLTYFVIFITVLAALLGAVHLLRSGAGQYLAWFVLTLAVSPAYGCSAPRGRTRRRSCSARRR